VATEERFRSTLTFDPRPIDGRRLPVPFPAFRNALPLGFMMPWLWDGLPPIGVGGALVQSPLPGQAGTGGVQLDVQPWRAQVYVDGVAAGSVEEFTGYYHHLEVNAGPHAIVIVAPDYEPLILDVFVSPGQVATYRGTLTRAPGR